MGLHLILSNAASLLSSQQGSFVVGNLLINITCNKRERVRSLDSEFYLRMWAHFCNLDLHIHLMNSVGKFGSHRYFLKEMECQEGGSWLPFTDCFLVPGMLHIYIFFSVKSVTNSVRKLLPNKFYRWHEGSELGKGPSSQHSRVRMGLDLLVYQHCDWISAPTFATHRTISKLLSSGASVSWSVEWE